jgi:hypothetical protein
MALCIPRPRHFQVPSSPLLFAVIQSTAGVPGEVFGHQVVESPESKVGSGRRPCRFLGASGPRWPECWSAGLEFSSFRRTVGRDFVYHAPGSSRFRRRHSPLLWRFTPLLGWLARLLATELWNLRNRDRRRLSPSSLPWCFGPRRPTCWSTPDPPPAPRRPGTTIQAFIITSPAGHV